MTILFTDRYKTTEKRIFADGQICKINPPKFICWDCKLWRYKGRGLTSYFYHEIESFVNIN